MLLFDRATAMDAVILQGHSYGYCYLTGPFLWMLLFDRATAMDAVI